MDKPAIELGNLMHEDNVNITQPSDLSAMIVNKRSRRSMGGKACADLFSLRQGSYWDDAKGGWLPADLGAEGRALEMEYVRKHGVYERVPRSQRHRETGRPPIRTGWADTNKGTSTEPNIRCRWVAKEFRTHADPELFAPTWV